jgi:NTE family protein
MFERKKVGLALGGGGARGLAHIGVLKILEKNNIPIDFIAGTSIGAVIGALYSSEPNSKKIEKEALETKWNDLFDYTIPRCGLIKGAKIEQYLEKKLGNIKFNQLKIPLYVTSFDIEKNQEVIFSRGDVAKAVRASISIPGIFIPVENNGKILVDGGVIDPIPTEILKKMGAEIIIAVNVDIVKERIPIFNEEATLKPGIKKIPNVLKTISRSLQVIESESSILDANKDKADLIINIDLEETGTLDFSDVKKSIKKGEDIARISLRKMKRLTEPNPFKLFLDELNENLTKTPAVGTIVKEVEKDIKKMNKKVEETKFF